MSEQSEKKKVVRMSFAVSEETYVRFWNYIKRKYVSTWRVFSKELEQAVIEYLDKHEKELESQPQQ